MTKRIVALTFVLLTLAPVSAFAKPEKLWLDKKADEAPKVQLGLPSFAPIIEKLGEAVVNISIEGKEKTPSVRSPFPQGGTAPSPFDFLFQMPQETEQRSFSSLGSGFIIHPDGYVVTNYHVVEKATKIFVTLKDDKKNYSAEIVGADPKTDLALLKVNVDKKLSAVVLGDSDNIRPGDWVIAIGNPFRLGHTATVGIVSAKSRKVPGGGPYDDFIQTDASINPGNSGGPLFNAEGEVVGINTAIFSPGRMGSTGFNIGIGFAVPINLVKTIVNQLHDSGKVTRGWLGVLIQQVSPDVASALQLENADGALVADVMKGSPAEKAGILRGDIIRSFDGKSIKESDELPLIVAETEIDSTVEIEVLRGKKSKKLDVKITELKDEEPKSAPSNESEETKLGLSIQEITPEIAKSLGVDDISGVVVTAVMPGTPAFLSGLQRGDIVLEVAGRAVNSTSDFRASTKDLKAGEPVLMLVRRGENTIFLVFKIEN